MPFKSAWVARIPSITWQLSGKFLLSCYLYYTLKS
nr:MAG TPA: hypothetical protein [Caudoviricetes sp.]